MTRARIFLAGSLILFGLFFTNVVLGAMYQSAVLNDVQEMILLLFSTALFCVSVLNYETHAQ